MKDDYIGDLMDIAAASRDLLVAAKSGAAVAEPPPVYAETIDALGAQEHAAMWLDLATAQNPHPWAEVW